MSAVEAEVTELPSSPGARLRREREARGLTQQQAAEQLTLDVSVVTALEANDFATLGAPVFAKGHLRRYAVLLGIPEDDILGGYERSKERPEQPTLVPKSRAEMAPMRGKSKWPLVLGGALAFLLAAGLAAYISANGLKLPWPKAASTQPAAESVESASAAAVPATNPAAGAVSSPATPAAGAAAVVPAGQVSLALRFSADSWVEIYDGTGKAVLYDLGKSGTVRSVTAVAPLSVTIGNAAAVGVAVNGRSVTPPSQAPGQTVARFSVGPDGTLR
jgi:cytoskeleton protein RodZ